MNIKTTATVLAGLILVCSGFALSAFQLVWTYPPNLPGNITFTVWETTALPGNFIAVTNIAYVPGTTNYSWIIPPPLKPQAFFKVSSQYK